MLNIKKIYSKKPRTEEGFTLIEVLVASLITFFFVIGSMQALVLATALRVKAQEQQRASQLIQEDIEQIQNAARDLAVDHSQCGATSYDPDGNLSNDPESYAQELSNNLPSVPANKQLLNGQGNTYGLNRIVDTTNSTAKVLKINFEVKEWDGSALVGNAIATDYIEVIPNAALQCPN